MKKQILLALSLIALIAAAASLSLTNTSPVFPQKNSPEMQVQADNKDLWTKVDSLIAEGLPKSALDRKSVV